MLEGLNEKKLGAIIVLIVALIAPAMILTAYAENGFHPPVTIMQRETIAIQNPCINENAASLNISLTILGFGDESIPIDAVKLSNITESSSPSVAVSVNGTYVNCASSPLFVIQPNDTAIVNMFVPYTSYPFVLSTLHDRKVVGIMVLTGQAMYYVECNPSSSGM
jgi:hypothetical protein